MDRKEYLKIKNKEYHLKNKEHIRKIKRAYYIKNKEKISEYHKKNREKFINNANNRRQKCIDSWKGYFPEKIKCPICDKELFFNVKNYRIAIHFDHREEGKEVIKCHPSMFLYTRFRTPENEKIWESCNFGMLCRRCNLHLHTRNRKDYLRKVIKYVFGEDFEIKKTS